MDIYFITSNREKLREAEEILGNPVKHIALELDEIQGLDTDKISEHKAKQAWGIVKKPLVTWDQSLSLACLHGFPGPLIKWFWECVTLEKICKIAAAFNDYGVSTTTTLTYYDGKILQHFYGELNGTIPPRPRGTKGFGWDPIFIPEGFVKTFAEMTPEEKNAISMHRIALEKLKKFLETLLKQTA